MPRKKKTPAQYHVWGSGPLEGETTLYRGTDRRAAEAAFDERAYRNYEGRGDDDEDVVIERDGRELRRFGPAIHQPTYFGGAPHDRHHATKKHYATKKSPAQLDREVTEALSKLRSKNFKLGLHKGYGGEWWIWRTTTDGDIVDTIGPFRTREGADTARVNLLLQNTKTTRSARSHATVRTVKHPRSSHAKMGRHGYENGQRVVVLDYLGDPIGTGRVRSGDNYSESDEYFTWVTMTRDGETVTEQWPTRRVVLAR